MHGVLLCSDCFSDYRLVLFANHHEIVDNSNRAIDHSGHCEIKIIERDQIVLKTVLYSRVYSASVETESTLWRQASGSLFGLRCAVNRESNQL